MLSCKKASELIDHQSVRRLSLKEKVMLRMHTGMCEGCTAYMKQSKVLDTILHKHFDISDETKVPPITNDPLKEKIISKL